MTSPPPGAVLSEDGHYWWDDLAQQWQLVAADPSAADPSAGGQSAGGQSAGGQSSGADGPGTAEAYAAIEGACIAQDMEDAEIDQVMAAAGVNLEDAFS